jgi:hypothetical protein
MTRHQRRKALRARKDRQAEFLLSRALRVLAIEKTRANLSSAPNAKRTPRGMVQRIYSGAAEPFGYTRPDRSSRGPAE